MENQNILTIKFNTLDDLAVQVADWHERLNHQCCGSCSNVEAPTVTVSKTIDVEVATPEVAEKVDVKQPKPVDAAPVQEDIPVTDFDGKPVKPKEESVEPAEEPVAETTPLETPVEEQANNETDDQDAALDITDEPVDKKAFFREMKAWMGEDKGRAGKIITVFNKYGVTERFSSDVLTNDIITDLKTVMVEEK
jgi:putative choline binding protein A|nr:MAG TPA: hypothetical protein [Caudoviricetes sp.]